jgi:hypothetical protein
LARWRIDGGEARTFAVAEWAARKSEVAIGAAGLLVLGSILVGLTEDAPPVFALITGAFVGALYLVIGLAKYGMEYHAAQRDQGEVLFYEDAVFMLGSWHELAGSRQLLRVELGADALELTVRWDTRNGPATDTIRVPVPVLARGEAMEVLRVLSSQVVGGQSRPES